MLAIDTNIIVRALVDDQPDQARKARSIIDSGPIFVSSTVLLETEWVLRRAYAFPVTAIKEALTKLAGLPNVSLDDPLAIADSLDWMSRGMDFADALHLAKAADCEAFMSFDRKLATTAKRLDAVPVRAP